MIRLIAVAFALVLATSAQAMPLAPLQQADGITTLARFGCGPGRTLVAGRCVARTTGIAAESSAEVFEDSKDETVDALPLRMAPTKLPPHRAVACTRP
jgi:hypothetical protein